MSSKIRSEIEEVTGVKQGRASSEADHAEILIDKIDALSEEDWNKLSKGAQAWFNEACDNITASKPIPAFPEEEETKTATRRGAPSAAKEPAAWVPQAGDMVIVTNKRGKVFEGEFVELDGDTAVVKVDGEEMEFTAERTESMVPAGGGQPEVGADLEPKVGDSVVLTTKRNAVIAGTITEINDEWVVLDVNGKEAEYERSRVTSIVIEGGGAGEAAAEPKVGDSVKAVTKRNKEVEGKVVEIDGRILVVETTGGDVDVDMDTAKSVEVVKDEKTAARGRRGATEPEAPAARSTRGTTATSPAAKEKGKTTKAENGGVSVGARMREVICENPDLKVEAIGKMLEKEKLSFKEATLKIVFKDVQTVIGLLKKLKRLK
jgi:ribosome maturation factor RimP